MRTIIAGSRDISNRKFVFDKLDEIHGDTRITVVISGTAKGADRYGEIWARINHISVNKFPADWKKYGKSAGYRRNEEMADFAEHAIVFWDGESKGAKHMIDIATRKGLLVTTILMPPEPKTIRRPKRTRPRWNPLG